MLEAGFGDLKPFDDLVRHILRTTIAEDATGADEGGGEADGMEALHGLMRRSNLEKIIPILVDNDIDSIAALRLLTEADFAPSTPVDIPQVQVQLSFEDGIHEESSSERIDMTIGDTPAHAPATVAEPSPSLQPPKCGLSFNRPSRASKQHFSSLFSNSLICPKHHINTFSFEIENISFVIKNNFVHK